MSIKPPVPPDVRRPKLPGPWDQFRQRLNARAHAWADKGRFGLRSARGVVICGLPRSGSTLLQLMLQTSYPGSRQFGKERAALQLALNVWPGRYSLLISKRPNDVFWIDEIRDGFRERAKRPCFIITTRDPRAVLTSKHGNRQDYYVSVQRWRAVLDHIRYARAAEDVTLVDYAELVQDPEAVQRRLTAAIGEAPAQGFDRSARTVPEGFETTALNGVRPIDTASLAKWREPANAERVHQILTEAPDLPRILIEEGYETDDRWADPYR